MAKALVAGLAILACALCASPIAARSVAIIVNFGDQGGAFEKTFGENTKRAADIYGGLGYDQVVIVSPTTNMRAAIAAAFQKVGSADKLDIETMGHGAIDTPPASLSGRFPKLNHPSSSGLYDDKPDSFHFHNGSSRTDPGFIAALDSGDFAKVTLAAQYRDDVGAGDFSKWIKQFRRASPKAPVKVSLVECYAGHAARTLEHIPGVHAYAASSDRLTMSAMTDPKRTQFYDFYLDEILAAKCVVPRRTELEAFDRARGKWVKVAKQMDDHLEVPWSPIDTFINNWCAENTANSNKATLSSGAEVVGQDKFATLKKSTDLSLRLEQEIIEDQNLRRRCSGTDKGERLKRKVNEAALLETKVLGRLLLANGLEADLQRRLETTRACLVENATAECPLDAEFSLNQIPGTWRDQAKEYSSCDTTSLDVIDKCLTQVRATANPGANALSAIQYARTELKREMGDCDRAESTRIYDYYKACYDRFWTGAGIEAWSQLADLNRLVQAPVGASGWGVVNEAADKTAR